MQFTSPVIRYVTPQRLVPDHRQAGDVPLWVRFLLKHEGNSTYGQVIPTCLECASRLRLKSRCSCPFRSGYCHRIRKPSR